MEGKRVETVALWSTVGFMTIGSIVLGIFPYRGESKHNTEDCPADYEPSLHTIYDDEAGAVYLSSAIKDASIYAEEKYGDLDLEPVTSTTIFCKFSVVNTEQSVLSPTAERVVYKLANYGIFIVDNEKAAIFPVKRA